MNKICIKLRYLFCILIIMVAIWPAQNVKADEEMEYMIKINRVANCLTVYQRDDDGGYTTAYKAMTCSTGLEMENTPLGTYQITDKMDWRKMNDGSFAQYCCRIKDFIMIHSVPYFKRSNDSLEVDEFNKLGEGASLGCIRLMAGDAKWIFDNCPEGTRVEIYDDGASPGPLGRPDTIDIPTNSENVGWDPTDPNEANPWNNVSPMISGAEDITIDKGSNIDFFKNILATDVCGNEVTDRVVINGEYDLDKPGEYQLQYYLEDAAGRTASADFKLTVEGEEETTQPATKPTDVIYYTETETNTGVGTIMKLIVIGVVTFIAASFIIKRTKEK